MAPSVSSSGSSLGNDGLDGGYTGSSDVVRMVIATLTAIAWYNALELNVLIFFTFHRYAGVYFWSLLVSSWGVVFYALGFLLKFFHLSDNEVVNVVFITIGWWCMITGQSMVLYSRLHLIVRNDKLLKRVLWMIVLDAVLLHIPTTVLTFGSNISGPHVNAFIRGYDVMEKIQMTGFFIQEAILSGIYLWESVKFLRVDDHGRKSRRTVYELFYINMIIIIMDISLLSIEYASLYILEISIKGVVYSVKLKLEFAILGKLVHYVAPRTREQSSATEATGMSEFVDFAEPDIAEPPSKTGPVIQRDSISDGGVGSKSTMGFEHVERITPQSGRYSGSQKLNSVHVEKHTTDLVREPSGGGLSPFEEDDIETMMRRYSVRH